jgi:L-aminopeptidase/D-esterase-like protein
MRWYASLLLALAQVSSIRAAERARDLGVPLEGTPGEWNAVTDVKGIEVGYRTLIAGTGTNAVRTGVTAVWPRGKDSNAPAFGAWFSLNGNGEMTGTTWLEEGGFLSGPVLITNTHSVGTVRDAFIKWQVTRTRALGRCNSSDLI